MRLLYGMSLYRYHELKRIEKSWMLYSIGTMTELATITGKREKKFENYFRGVRTVKPWQQQWDAYQRSEDL
jgi:hypothetical protein